MVDHVLQRGGSSPVVAFALKLSVLAGDKTRAKGNLSLVLRINSGQGPISTFNPHTSESSATSDEFS
ncbi:uncharacterized protein J3R85_009681 [Psidium guajava]|nr:uncharacterized protein J3R85_009681 [Psidium guajava]